MAVAAIESFKILNGGLWIEGLKYRKAKKFCMKNKSQYSVYYFLAPHGALAVIAFRYYPTTLPSYIFQIFSSNLLKPITRGGINWSLCGSNSLGTSHSTQGRDDSSSSSIAGLNCMYCILVYIGVMSVRTSR